MKKVISQQTPMKFRRSSGEYFEIVYSNSGKSRRYVIISWYIWPTKIDPRGYKSFKQICNKKWDWSSNIECRVTKNNRGWIWSKLTMYMYGNITLKPFAQLMHTHLREKNVSWGFKKIGKKIGI
jgi:hypothetical protein